MGWSFRATCRDCLHTWEGIETFASIGPYDGTHFDEDCSGYQSWACRRCCLLLTIPARIDRNSWRNWYSKFKRECGPDISPFLRDIAARIDLAVMQGAKSLPVVIQLEPFACPSCRELMEPSDPATEHDVICPRCSSRSKGIEGYECHCSMEWDPRGFS
jgi:hypothetical protein